MGLWESYSKPGTAGRNDRAMTDCVLHMARIDPELALTWSAHLGGRLDRYVRLTAAETVAEIDSQEAIALLNEKPDRDTQEGLQDLSERLAETDPAKALVLAEEAAVQARAMDEPGRIRAKARAGAVLIRLGRPDAGRKLVEEAVEALSRIGVEDRNVADRAARTRVLIATARALARFDPKRAQALLDTNREPDPRGRVRVLLAYALAASDPARAVALADSLPEGSRDRYFIRTEAAYRIGAERPDEALGIVEGMKGREAIGYRAEALGWRWRSPGATPSGPSP